VSEEELKNLIVGWQNNQSPERDVLLALAYQFIRRLSAKYYSDLPEGANTFLLSQSATDLAHDVYIKLKNSELFLPIESVRQFYSYINVAVRNCFIDSYRASVAKKSRALEKTTLTSADAINQTGRDLDDEIELSLLTSFIEKLADKYPRAAEILELRYFSQLSNKEIARLLNVSLRTVENDISFAKIWLSKKLM
jgi:RNA polymerase sigma factor (TIGR02999 family)